MLFKFKPDWYIYEFVFWSYIKLLLSLSSSGTCMEATWKLFRLTCFLISGTYVICKWIRLLFPHYPCFRQANNLMVFTLIRHILTVLWPSAYWMTVSLTIFWLGAERLYLCFGSFLLTIFLLWLTECLFLLNIRAGCVRVGLSDCCSVPVRLSVCLIIKHNKKKLFSCQVPGIKPHRNNARRLVFQAKRFVAIVSWIMRYC